MPTDLLGLLRLCLLVLLYLFFFRVLRAVWVEVRGPSPAIAEAAATARGKPRHRSRSARPAGDGSTLHVTAPDERKGTTYAIAGETTLGRATGCQIHLTDDTFVSQLHARLSLREGLLFVEDLGSTNGTYLNNRKVEGPTAVHRGDLLQVGKTAFEVR